MAPFNVAGAISHTSLIGPLTRPAEPVVISTLTGSCLPLAFSVTAAHTLAGSGMRSGFVGPKQPWYSNPLLLMWT